MSRIDACVKDSHKSVTQFYVKTRLEIKVQSVVVQFIGNPENRLNQVISIKQKYKAVPGFLCFFTETYFLYLANPISFTYPFYHRIMAYLGISKSENHCHLNFDP